MRSMLAAAIGAAQTGVEDRRELPCVLLFGLPSHKPADGQTSQRALKLPARSPNPAIQFLAE
jgi:hypothetical protein